MPHFPDLSSASLNDNAARVIVFEDFELSVRIGAYEAEKLRPQRMRITVELLVRPSDPDHGDRLDKVVDYAAIHDAVMALAGKPHIELQERLADEVARICLEPAEVEATRVYVRKLDAYPDCASVGIRIVRTKVRP